MSTAVASIRAEHHLVLTPLCIARRLRCRSLRRHVGKAYKGRVVQCEDAREANATNVSPEPKATDDKYSSSDEKCEEDAGNDESRDKNSREALPKEQGGTRADRARKGYSLGAGEVGDDENARNLLAPSARRMYAPLNPAPD